MPKIDLDAVHPHEGSGYPAPFDVNCAGRVRRRLGEAGGMSDFGLNLMTLPPGGWSSQRHWHSHEDEFVYVLEGEVVLVEDGAETLLQAGECAAFPKGSQNGHHLVNRATTPAVFLEIGSRHELDLCSYSDIDMQISKADDRFLHKDGSPYADQK